MLDARYISRNHTCGRGCGRFLYIFQQNYIWNQVWTPILEIWWEKTHGISAHLDSWWNLASIIVLMLPSILKFFQILVLSQLCYAKISCFIGGHLSLIVKSFQTYDRRVYWYQLHSKNVIMKYCFSYRFYCYYFQSLYHQNI